MDDLDVGVHGELFVVSPAGDVDLTNAADLRAAVLARPAADATAVVIDLSRTRYLDSAGIQTLFSMAARLTERRRGFGLVVPPDSPLRRVLEIVGAPSVIGMHDTHEAARAALVAPDGPPVLPGPDAAATRQSPT